VPVQVVQEDHQVMVVLAVVAVLQVVREVQAVALVLVSQEIVV
jgi:hypothetical protein